MNGIKLKLLPLLTIGLLCCTSENNNGASPPTDSDGTDSDTLPRNTDSDSLNSDSCALAPGGPLYNGTHGLRFEGEDGTSVYLERTWVDWGQGESSLFQLDTMIIAAPGKCVVIEDDAALNYANSHHNWADIATGTAEGQDYVLTMELGFSDADSTGSRWHVALTVNQSASSQPVGEPTSMILTGGPLGMGWLPRIHINEFMVVGSDYFADEGGNNEPWIELFNGDAVDMDISGYHLSNDPANPARWTLPTGTVLNRHEYLVIVADGHPERGALHTNFLLSEESGFLRLSAPDGESYGERAYHITNPASSMMWDYDTDGFTPATVPTPGNENQ